MRPRKSARRWSGGLFSFGTRLPCLMAETRQPLSTMVKQFPKLVQSKTKIDFFSLNNIIKEKYLKKLRRKKLTGEAKGGYRVG